jgi:hypothetical protein
MREMFCTVEEQSGSRPFSLTGGRGALSLRLYRHGLDP